MSNGNREYIDSKNYKAPSLLDAFQVDTEVGMVDNEVSEMTLAETLVLDEARRFGLVEEGEEGELLKSMGGSGDINPESGRRRFTPVVPPVTPPPVDPSMIQAAGTAAGQVGAQGGGGKDMLKSAAMAIDPVLGTMVMIGDLWYGANKAAEANRAKMKKIGEGIAKINDKRQQLGERAREDIANIWEGVGSKLSDIRAGAGNTFENLSDKVGDVVQRGKGLATGDAEQMVDKTTTNVQENLTRTTENLEDTASTQIEGLGRRMEDETESMTMEIKDMQEEIGELSKKQYGYQNIL